MARLLTEQVAAAQAGLTNCTYVSPSPAVAMPRREPVGASLIASVVVGRGSISWYLELLYRRRLDPNPITLHQPQVLQRPADVVLSATVSTSVANNAIAGNADAIHLSGSNNNKINSNQTKRFTHDGIWLDSTSSGNKVTGNVVSGSGILTPRTIPRGPRPRGRPIRGPATRSRLTTKAVA
jgi:parallel beta-helix repeat protein